MELYIVRHGETDWNAEGRMQGGVDRELSSRGRELAGDLGRRLEDVEFDRIYSSPLIRAYETACLIRGYRNISILRDERLREISFGCLEGSLYSEWRRDDCPYRHFFTDPGRYLPPEGGETLEALCDRARAFLKEEIEPLAEGRGADAKDAKNAGAAESGAAAAEGKDAGTSMSAAPGGAPCRVMIVGHGALNKALMCYLEGHGTDEFWGKSLQKNCEATIFTYDGERWRPWGSPA